MAKSSRRFVGFQRTRFRRAPTPALAGPAASIGVRGIEISQCIQDLANSVTLVADKATIARLYLDAATVAKAGNVTAELAWSHEGGAEAYLPAMNTVRLDPAKDGGVQNQRTDLSQSLNFRLPPQAIGAGQLQLRLSRVYTPAGSDLPVGAPDTCTVSFTAAPPLRIRVIGLRYRIGTKTVAPDAVHFNYLRSYLGRAYPVAALEWSQVVVDADFASPFDDSTVDLANAQIAALRSREVSNGVDPRTHYFGLVSDNGGDHFMRGKAFAIPSSPSPTRSRAVLAARPARGALPEIMICPTRIGTARMNSATPSAVTIRASRRTLRTPATPAFPMPMGSSARRTAGSSASIRETRPCRHRCRRCRATCTTTS